MDVRGSNAVTSQFADLRASSRQGCPTKQADHAVDAANIPSWLRSHNSSFRKARGRINRPHCPAKRETVASPRFRPTITGRIFLSHLSQVRPSRPATGARLMSRLPRLLRPCHEYRPSLTATLSVEGCSRCPTNLSDAATSLSPRVRSRVQTGWGFNGHTRLRAGICRSRTLACMRISVSKPEAASRLLWRLAFLRVRYTSPCFAATNPNAHGLCFLRDLRHDWQSRR